MIPEEVIAVAIIIYLIILLLVILWVWRKNQKFIALAYGNERRVENENKEKSKRRKSGFIKRFFSRNNREQGFEGSEKIVADLSRPRESQERRPLPARTLGLSESNKSSSGIWESDIGERLNRFKL